MASFFSEYRDNDAPPAAAAFDITSSSNCNTARLPHDVKSLDEGRKSTFIDPDEEAICTAVERESMARRAENEGERRAETNTLCTRKIAMGAGVVAIVALVVIVALVAVVASLLAPGRDNAAPATLPALPPSSSGDPSGTNSTPTSSPPMPSPASPTTLMPSSLSQCVNQSNSLANITALAAVFPTSPGCVNTNVTSGNLTIGLCTQDYGANNHTNNYEAACTATAGAQFVQQDFACRCTASPTKASDSLFSFVRFPFCVGVDCTQADIAMFYDSQISTQIERGLESKEAACNCIVDTTDGAAAYIGANGTVGAQCANQTGMLNRNNALNASFPKPDCLAVAGTSVYTCQEDFGAASANYSAVCNNIGGQFVEHDINFNCNSTSIGTYAVFFSRFPDCFGTACSSAAIAEYYDTSFYPTLVQSAEGVDSHCNVTGALSSNATQRR